MSFCLHIFTRIIIVGDVTSRDPNQEYLSKTAVLTPFCPAFYICRIGWWPMFCWVWFFSTELRDWLGRTSPKEVYETSQQSCTATVTSLLSMSTDRPWYDARAGVGKVHSDRSQTSADRQGWQSSLVVFAKYTAACNMFRHILILKLFYTSANERTPTGQLISSS